MTGIGTYAAAFPHAASRQENRGTRTGAENPEAPTHGTDAARTGAEKDRAERREPPKRAEREGRQGTPAATDSGNPGRPAAAPADVGAAAGASESVPEDPGTTRESHTAGTIAAFPSASAVDRNTAPSGSGNAPFTADTAGTVPTEVPAADGADSAATRPAGGARLLAEEDGSFPFGALSCEEPVPQRDTLYRPAPADAVFGPASTIAPQQPGFSAQPPSLTESPVFQGFVLLLAATYALLICRHTGDAVSLLSRISRNRATGRRLQEDPGGSGFPRFLNIATTIGMLFLGVVVVKYGDSLMPSHLLEMLPRSAALAMSLVATLACGAVILYQWLVIRLIGAVTLSQPLLSQLMLLRRTYFSLAVVVASPVLLLFALCPRGTGGAWFCIIVIELVVTAILYLRETLDLFLSKKVSILHWFLYLCTVEVFPISLLWLLAVR